MKSYIPFWTTTMSIMVVVALVAFGGDGVDATSFHLRSWSSGTDKSAEKAKMENTDFDIVVDGLARSSNKEHHASTTNNIKGSQGVRIKVRHVAPVTPSSASFTNSEDDSSDDGDDEGMKKEEDGDDEGMKKEEEEDMNTEIDVNLLGKTFALAYNNVHFDTNFRVVALTLNHEEDTDEDNGDGSGSTTQWITREFWTDVDWVCDDCPSDAHKLPTTTAAVTVTTPAQHEDEHKEKGMKKDEDENENESEAGEKYEDKEKDEDEPILLGGGADVHRALEGLFCYRLRHSNVDEYKSIEDCRILFTSDKP